MMSAAAESDSSVEFLSTPRIRTAFCTADLSQVEESLQRVLDTMHARREVDANAAVAACRSLLRAYAVAVGALAASDSGDRLLRLTVCAGRFVETLCSLRGAQRAVSCAALEVLTPLLHPDGAVAEPDFWRCHRWYCCLLRHCPVGPGGAILASQAAAAAAHHYAALPLGNGMGVMFDVLAFTAAAAEVTGAPRSLAESTAIRRSRDGLGETLGGPLLGHSLDVEGARLVESFLRAGDGWRGRGESLGLADMDTPLVATPVGERGDDEQDGREVVLRLENNTHELHEKCEAQRSLFVATKLGTLFAAQDLHTLLQLAARQGDEASRANSRSRNGNGCFNGVEDNKKMSNKDKNEKNGESNAEEGEDDDYDDEWWSECNTGKSDKIKSSQEKATCRDDSRGSGRIIVKRRGNASSIVYSSQMKTNSILPTGADHCAVCAVMAGRLDNFEGSADSLLLLNPAVSTGAGELQRATAAERAAAAALAALLRHDGQVADAALCIAARAAGGSAARYFIALWRGAISSAQGNVVRLAWLLAGLTRAIHHHRRLSLPNVTATLLESAKLAADDAARALEFISPSLARDYAVAAMFEVCAATATISRSANHCCMTTLSHAIAIAAALPTLASPRSASSLAHMESRMTDSNASPHADTTVTYVPSLSSPPSSLGGWRWWPAGVVREEGYDAKSEDLYNTTDAVRLCRRVLLTFLTVCKECREGTWPLDTLGGGFHGAQRHPASSLLAGSDGPCVQLLSLQPAPAARRGVGQLQSLAADIVAATSTVLCTPAGRAAFQSPFGEADGRYASTYTRLLYLRFLQEARQASPQRRLMRSLLQALRLLCVAERGAHRTAVNLSIPLMLSRMLPESVTPRNYPEEATAISEEVSALTDKEKASKDETRDKRKQGKVEYGEGEKIVKGEEEDEEGKGEEDPLVDELGSASETSTPPLVPAPPRIPMLSLATLAPPQYYTSNGDTGAALEPSMPPPPPPPPPTIPSLDLTLAKQSQAPQEATAATAPPILPPLMHKTVASPSSPHLPRFPLQREAIASDAGTVAELLAFLSALLPGREGGMVSQSSLDAAHHRATRKRSQWRHLDSSRTPSPLVCVLRRLESFTRDAANAAAITAFDAILTESVSEVEGLVCPLMAGVDVLRRLLVPRPRLLDGLHIARRIGSGGYGAVFNATRHDAAGDVHIALKMVPIALHGLDDCAALLSCHTEATALFRLCGHPRIGELLFCGRTTSQYVFAMPLYAGGSLREWRVARSGFPLGPSSDILAVCGPIFAQFLEAVEFMHANHIRHNDLKADNVLIESFQVRQGAGAVVVPTAVRLSDFGVCEVIGEDASAVRNGHTSTRGAVSSGDCWGPTRGTEAVQAPEVLAPRVVAPVQGTQKVPSDDNTTSNTSPSSPIFTPVHVAAEGDYERVCERELAADMWACGCLLYELLTGSMLFGGENLGRLLALAGSLHQRERMKGEVLQSTQCEVLNACGDGIADFAMRLLALDPQERLTATAARSAWETLLQTITGQK